MNKITLIMMIMTIIIGINGQVTPTTSLCDASKFEKLIGGKCVVCLSGGTINTDTNKCVSCYSSEKPNETSIFPGNCFTCPEDITIVEGIHVCKCKPGFMLIDTDTIPKCVKKQIPDLIENPTQTCDPNKQSVNGSCQLCNKGFNSNGKGPCIACPVGTGFQNKSDSLHCASCGVGMTSIEGSACFICPSGASIKDGVCVCENKQYLINVNTNPSCSSTPQPDSNNSGSNGNSSSSNANSNNSNGNGNQNNNNSSTSPNSTQTKTSGQLIYPVAVLFLISYIL